MRYIWLLGASPPDPHRGSAPGPRWGTSVPQTPCAHPTSNPGYATVCVATVFPPLAFEFFAYVKTKITEYFWLPLNNTSIINDKTLKIKYDKKVFITWQRSGHILVNGSDASSDIGDIT